VGTCSVSLVALTLAQGTNGELDTTELETLFDIVRRSQGEQTVIVNGRTDSFRRWTLTLVPRTTGPLTVPPVSVGGVSSQPLRLDVGNAPTGAERVLFVELDVDECRRNGASLGVQTLLCWMFNLGQMM